MCAVERDLLLRCSRLALAIVDCWRWAVAGLQAPRFPSRFHSLSQSLGLPLPLRCVVMNRNTSRYHFCLCYPPASPDVGDWTASVFSVVVVILVRNLASVDSLLMSVLLIFVPSWDFASRLVLEDSRRSSELFKHEKDLI